MDKRNVTANFNISQIFADIVIITICYILSCKIFWIMRGAQPGNEHLWMLFVFIIVFVMSMIMMRMYNITTFYYLDRTIQRICISVLISSVCLGAVIFLSKMKTASRLIFVIFCVASCAATMINRLVLRWIRASRIGNGYTHVLFIGNDYTKEKYISYIDKTDMKIKIDHMVSLDDPILSDPEAFESYLVKITVDEVIAVYSSTPSDDKKDLPAVLSVCEDMGITVRLLLDLYDLPHSKRFVSSIGTFPMLTYHSTSFNKVQLFLKSAMDVVGALVGLIVFSPVFLITAIAIKRESPGPVLFKQTRVGRNGKLFKMYKFRSMYEDAEDRKKELMEFNQVEGGLMFKMENDPRITKVGAFIRKTSIDELPQLVNVLIRNMSLVGTRPPTTDEVVKYDRGHRKRISIMPGITGIWQVSGRSDILDFNEVVALDKQYIEEWSIFLDIKLIFKTVSAVVMRKGAK